MAVAVVFGAVEGDHVAFELGAPENGEPLETLPTRASVVSQGHSHYRLLASGVEPLALAALRDDLRSLIAERAGELTFADHDLSVWVHLSWDDDTIGGTADVVGSGWTTPLPTEGVFTVQLDAMSVAEVSEDIARIDEIETEVGPLTGHCGACGKPASTWSRHQD